MEKKWTVTGLLLLITGIILGAFGAHALKDAIHDPEMHLSYETGVRYQLFHALAFLIVPFIAKRFEVETKLIYGLVLTGILLFSVSIYLLTIRGLIGMDGLKMVAGPLTPLGGSLMIIGWSVLLVRILRKP